MNEFISNTKKAVLVSFILLIICGLIYPLLVTGMSQLIFNKKANGSIISVNGVNIGSEIVGQKFESDCFMKGRPSAVNYNTYTKKEKSSGVYSGVASGSNNYAQSNIKLLERMEKDTDNFLKENSSVKKEEIPSELLTASGSGLDPHISLKSAEIQIPRIAKVTKISEKELGKIVSNNTRGKWLGIFGEEVVNVLNVNIEIAKKIKMI